MELPQENKIMKPSFEILQNYWKCRFGESWPRRYLLQDN